jgi:hypothetical protein
LPRSLPLPRAATSINNTHPIKHIILHHSPSIYIVPTLTHALFMNKQVCDAFKWSGKVLIFAVWLGLLLSVSRYSFAADKRQIEWVVVQGIACVDANRDNTCASDEPKVPQVIVRSDGVELARTDAAGRFSARVPAQSVLEFEVPAGYKSTTDGLSTQVFESGRIDVPLAKLEAPIATRTTATRAAPTATAKAVVAATARATATAIPPTSTPPATPTVRPTSTNTPAPKPTSTPEPSVTPRRTATPSAVPPTQTPSTETPAPTPAVDETATAQASATEQAAATETAAAIATATEAASATPLPTETAVPTDTPSVSRAFNNDATTQAPTAQATPLNPNSGFGEEAQAVSRFSFGAIPLIYVVSVVVLLAVASLLGWLLYRANALKSSALATATAGGFAPQTVVWESGSSQATLPLLTGAEWHPIAERLIRQSRLKSVSINAEAGILAASIMPMPVFMLAGQDGTRLVFTIDPSLPVRTGLVADRRQITGVARLHGSSRNDAHTLWTYVARARDLPNAAYPTWADWYLLVC